MSGKRKKALRREFRQTHGRSPETTATQQRGVIGWLKSKIKPKDDHGDLLEKKSRPIMALLVTDSCNEFRQFKRSRRANG